MAIKILIGGSPCTYWSIAQKNNRETEASGMGWELFKNYLIAKEKFKPDFFLYENNKSAAQAIKDQVAKELGVGIDPDVRFTYINSALVSAQNRQRFYVTNFGDIEQPEDRGILLKDVLETGVIDKDKAYCLKHQAGNTRDYFKKHHTQVAAEPVYIGEVPEHKGTYRNGKQASQQYRVYDTNGKSVAVTTCAITNVAEPVGIGYRGRMEDGKWVKRFESNGEPKANALTTAQTDSMVAEPIRVGDLPNGKGKISGSQATRIYSLDGKSVNLVANGGGQGAKTGLYAIPVRIPEYGNADKSRPVRASYCHKGSGEGSLQTEAFPDNPNKQVSDYVAESVTIDRAIAVDSELLCIGDEVMRVNEATKKGFADVRPGECVDLQQPNSKTRRGRNMSDKANCLCTTNGHYQYLGRMGYATPCEWDENGIPTKAVSCADGKTYTVYKVEDGMITIKGKQYPIKLVDGYYIIRKLTVTECCRLQTMPDDYCKAVSDSQAYKALGNGWTAEVIIHLLNHALKDIPRDEEIVVLSLYDGIATGRYCLDKMGFTNVKYYAYEIDKYPIMVAMDNYPNIVQCGDAFAVREKDWKPPQTRLEKLDDLLAN